MQLQAKSRLVTAQPDVAHAKEQVTALANQIIQKLSAAAPSIGLTHSQVVQYVGNFLHEEILPCIEQGDYDAQFAGQMLNSVTLVEIAHHFNIDADKISRARMQKEGDLMAQQPSERARILKKLNLSEAEFHALRKMIMSGN